MAEKCGSTVTYMDLFSGVGALRLGFEQACGRLGIDAQCRGYSEIDKNAVATYRRHYGAYTPGSKRAISGSVHGKVPGVAVGVPNRGLEILDEGARKQAEDWARSNGHHIVSSNDPVKIESLF
jgi:site-specific DNA-cytosine methylase